MGIVYSITADHQILAVEKIKELVKVSKEKNFVRNLEVLCSVYL